MNGLLRRRHEIAAQAREFLRAHRTEVASEAMNLTHLEELLLRAESLASQQRARVVASRSATVEREDLRRKIQKLLRFLVMMGAVAAKQDSDLAVQFRLPSLGASNRSFLTAARGMLDIATARRDLLVSLGMSASLLVNLAAAVEEFEKTLEAIRAGRRDHVGANAELDAVATEIAEQVRLLDGWVRYRFGDNAELMAAWTSGHDVLGPFKSRGEPDADGRKTPETGADPVASAA